MNFGMRRDDGSRASCVLSIVVSQCVKSWLRVVVKM